MTRLRCYLGWHYWAKTSKKGMRTEVLPHGVLLHEEKNHLCLYCGKVKWVEDWPPDWRPRRSAEELSGTVTDEPPVMTPDVPDDEEDEA